MLRLEELEERLDSLEEKAAKATTNEVTDDTVTCKLLVWSGGDHETLPLIRVFLNENGVTYKQYTTYSGSKRYEFKLTYEQLIELVKFGKRSKDDFEISF